MFHRASVHPPLAHIDFFRYCRRVPSIPSRGVALSRGDMLEVLDLELRLIAWLVPPLCHASWLTYNQTQDAITTFTLVGYDAYRSLPIWRSA